MSKKYKILLSAYACNPYKGSEPGIGWNWAVEVANRGHQVYVFTRTNNKKYIEQFLLENGRYDNIKFIYHDLSPWLLKLKKIMGVYLYYELWQLTILSKAKYYHNKVKFDLIHHITFGTFRQNTSLYKLNVPFFLGPVGGGEHTTIKLLRSFPLKSLLSEHLRNLSNFLTMYNYSLQKSYGFASLIFCTSNQTKRFIPNRKKNHIKINLAIGVLDNLTQEKVQINDKEEIKVLFTGRLLYWKGVHLAISAFDLSLKRYGNLEFNILGSGPDEIKLKSFADKLKANGKISWTNWIDYERINFFFQQYDVFLFPSLHDSGGFVILEALSNGLPVICLDLGGPGQIVNNTCGRVISTVNKTEAEVITELSEALNELVNNRELLLSLSKGAIKRAKEFTWDKTVDKVYIEIENYMDTYVKN